MNTEADAIRLFMTANTHNITTRPDNKIKETPAVPSPSAHFHFHYLALGRAPFLIIYLLRTNVRIKRKIKLCHNIETNRYDVQNTTKRIHVLHMAIKNKK